MEYFSTIAKSWRQLHFTFLALTVFCSTVFAANRPKDSYYRIEMIIYSDINHQNIQAEQWPSINNKLNIPSYFENIYLDNDGSATQKVDETNIMLLNSDELQLNDIQHTLENKLGAQILAHFGWQQDFSKQAKAFLHIQNTINARTYINGLFTITLNRYFNTSFHILFAQPVEQIQALNVNTNAWSNIIGDHAYFDLYQNRRMRSNELNYLDHPLYGIIIKITPATQGGNKDQ